MALAPIFLPLVMVITLIKRKKIVSIEDPVGPEKWVFPQANDTVGHPHSFTTFMRRFCINNKLAKASTHLFRHMAGSYLLRAVIDIAGGNLGHASKSFTMKTYIHEMQSEKAHSANAMETILINLKEKSDPESDKGQLLNPVLCAYTLLIFVL